MIIVRFEKKVSLFILNKKVSITRNFILQSVDRNTDITYQVCAEGGGGAVSIRDFVYLRHWELVDGVYVCAMISTKHSTVPPHQKRVR